ncbi:hypothetical protein B9Z55_004989 [Caenorhabditis nigoni]|uniref:Uncharacterized protein n=1 Tax=Caenorhabditis nigoni TaxID=1611254 RepID=A0A2G5UYV5_9PELO|nr:hypothetical protein B9Z55_004989 [Caenorhabditis nigoni]
MCLHQPANLFGYIEFLSSIQSRLLQDLPLFRDLLAIQLDKHVRLLKKQFQRQKPICSSNTAAREENKTFQQFG